MRFGILLINLLGNKGKIMCKLGWILSLVLFLVLGAMSYTFLVKGETVPASDGRQAIVLPEGERDLVLGEMRQFLIAVQGIVSSVNKDDMEGVVKYARQVGFAAQQAVPVSLMKKLPMEFKKLGMGTHKAFDQLAMDASEFGDKGQTMEQLGTLMQNCVSCHAVYRIDPELTN
jgi:mono/diheme cytochrome c family protein